MASNISGFGKRQRQTNTENREESTPRPAKQPRLQNWKGTENGQASLSQSVLDSAPMEVTVAKFAQCRARELEALTQTVEQVAGNKLSFQRLPKHMRRRAMSHNIRRIPRRLRQRAQAEMEKREKKGASKRPSRRYRRRPSNLLSEYQRRQRRHMWLETHIWHAKRFRMTTAWNYRLPVHPSDKSLRACYRASTHHCLLQDVSYECCIQIRGTGQDIVDMLSHLTSKDTGLTFGARVSITGQRWGKVMMYTCDTYPQGAVAPITFLWHPPKPQQQQREKRGDGKEDGGEEEEVRTLWMWCHPASYVEVWNQLMKACTLLLHSSQSGETPGTSTPSDSPDSQPRRVMSASESPAHGGTQVQVGQLHVRSLKDQLVKFRLSGPASTLILSQVLKPAAVRAQATGSGRERLDESAVRWWMKYYSDEGKEEELAAQGSSWERISKCQSPGEVPPRAVVALTVRDPRILLPSVRTKAALDKADSALQVITWDHLPAQIAVSPLVKEDIRQEVTQTKLTEQEMNRRRSELLVPGSVLQLGDEESRIPVLLLQRPGCQPACGRESSAVRYGVGSGWDLVAPKGWAMAFWIALVYRGARVGGLRECRSLTLRSSQLHFPHDFPDSAAGSELQRERRGQCLDKHVRRPPAKRVNYPRLGVPAPFHCPWAQLVAEWQERAEDILNTVGESCDKGKKPSLARGPGTGSGVPLPEPEESLNDDEVGEQSISGSGNPGRERSPYPVPYVLRCRQLLRALQDAVAIAKHHGGAKTQKGVGTRLSAMLAKPVPRGLVEKHLGSLVPFTVSCQSRGVPVERAMICLPTASDLEQLAKDAHFPGPTEALHPCRKSPAAKMVKKKKKKSVAATPVSAAENTNKVTKAGKTEPARKGAGNKVPKGALNPRQQQEKEELMKEPSRLVDVANRLIVGFLTNGDFDLGQGHGVGVGLCCLSGVLTAFRDSPQNQPLRVLVRNPTSRQYRFATLSPLP